MSITPEPCAASATECLGTVEKWASLSEQISLCGRLLRSWIAEHSKPCDAVNEVELSLLWACRNSAAGGISQKELADALAVSPAHVSGLVELLRQKGLLKGRRAATDRRRRLWQITPKGQTELEATLVRLSDWAANLNRQADNLPDQLLPLIERLKAAIKALRADGPSGRAGACSDSASSARRSKQRGAA